MYAAGQKWLQKARIDVAQARNVCSRPEWLQKARIDATRARNVCSRPEINAEGQDRCSTSQIQQARMVAEGQDRCSPGQECMQLARKGCSRPG
jgi:hypothetical protein